MDLEPQIKMVRRSKASTIKDKEQLEYTSTMEVEVKLRLKDSTAHHELKNLLSEFHIKTIHQHNFFFDTSTLSISSQRSVLALRFLDNAARCIIYLKSKPTLINGVSRVGEDVEQLDPIVAKDCIEDPMKLLDLKSRVMERVRDEFGSENEMDLFVCLGGFENVREVYEWKGLKLEVDETKFEFGTSYEIECESDDPDRVKTELEGFLKDNGIEYNYSEMSKFAVFRAAGN